ncbi:Na-translocating system protein MpsC family protein [Capsulimonas corticalis]|nr:Na-translocating system protein MpsC family protein [Capsulimonas corticalis]
MTRRKQWLELESAFRLTEFVKREFGLTPGEAHAELCGDDLKVHLTRALTPIGLIISQDAQGAEALRCVYSVLYKANRSAMESIVGRIAGAPARCRQMDIDLESANVTLCFQVDAVSSVHRE